MALSRIAITSSVAVAATLVAAGAAAVYKSGGPRAAGLLTDQNGRSAISLVAQRENAGGTRSGNGSSGGRSGGVATVEDDQKIARMTSLILSQLHYTRRPFDDAISAKLFDRYVDTLDPQHIYFLQSDLDEFAPLRTKLDDLTLRGDTSAAKLIFDRYLERFAANVAFVESRLKEETFTFNDDESFTIDRSKEPRPADADAAKALWEKRLRYDALQEKLNNTKPADIPTNINKRYARQLRSFREFDADDIFELYLNTLALVYDPHSAYTGRAKSEDFDISMRLSLFGIGALLTSEDGYAKISELTPGGPAIRSKLLKPGDRIVAVKQEDKPAVDVVDMKLPNVVDLIRGPKGTKVTLTLWPADAADPSVRKTITLTRDEVKLEEQAAKARLIETPGANGKPVRLGVIDLPLFYRDDEKGKSATKDVARLLARLKKENVAGVILDLRRNGGGSLPEAISMAGLFIKQGPVVQTREPDGDVTVDQDEDPSVAYGGPLIVLTSRLSASASEIVTGALQDYGRALIVGESTTTFGKGTVQAVLGLAPYLERQRQSTTVDPGTLRLTIQKFYRASGSSTQLKGVAPEIVLPSLTNLLDAGEKSLDDPLPWDTIPSAKYTKLNQVTPYVAALKKRSDARIAADKDFVYLRSQIARIQKAKAQKVVSLNEATRRKERAETEAIAKARQKELAARPASKEKVYALTLANIGAPTLPKPLAAVTPSTKTPPPTSTANDGSLDEGDVNAAAAERDITLDETRRILLDYIALSAAPAPPAKTVTQR